MKKIDLKTSLLVLSLVVTTVIATTVVASADEDSTIGKMKGKMMNSEHRQEMMDVMENGDYETFKSFTPQNEKVAERHDNITEDQFNQMIEAHNLRQSGDYEGAREIMEELGFDKMSKMHGKRGANNFNSEKRAEMKVIMESGDYEAFKAIDPKNEEMAERHNNVTEDQFNQMIEAHNLRVGGDHEGAREIMEELGFERPEGRSGNRGNSGNRMGN